MYNCYLSFSSLQDHLGVWESTAYKFVRSPLSLETSFESHMFLKDKIVRIRSNRSIK